MRFVTSSLLIALLALPLSAQPPAKPDQKKPAESKPAPGSLEDVISQALRNSPEIHAAEAKVRSAEADLQKTRMEVLQKVTTAKFALDAAKKNVDVSKEVLDYQTKLHQKSFTDAATLRKSQLELERSKAEVQRLEADLNALLGRVPGKQSVVQQLNTTQFWNVTPYMDDWRHSLLQPNTAWSATLNPTLLSDGTVRWAVMNQPYAWHAELFARTAPTSVSERIRIALDKPIKLDAPKEALPLTVTLEMLRKKAGVDVPIRVLAANKSLTIELMAGELPLGAWLQAVEDSAPEIAMAVREYGILVTLKERLPRDAEPIRDFWRRSRAEQAKPKEKPASKKQ